MSHVFDLRLGLTVAVSVLGFTLTVQGEEGTNSVPRYRLQVGQELKYRGSSEFKFKDGSHGSQTEWQAWVVRQNDDGSWRLVLQSSNKFIQKRDGRELDNNAPARVTLAYCDIFPDGRITSNDTLGFHLEPSVILPKLPETPQQAKEGWKSQSVDGESQTEFKPLAESTPETLVFEGIRQSAMDKIYESSSHSKYTFDVKRGVVKQIDTATTQGYGFNGKGTGTTELTALEQHDAAWTKQFAEETDRYFAANKAYEELQTQASKDAKQVKALLAQAETTLKEAREKLTLPVLQAQVDNQLKNHENLISYFSEEAKNREAILGHPAADWDAKDLDGKSHALKDYRGKVVVLDFWYRGCGWCIRAMPQMKQLADDFKGDPVAILGMNTDQEEKNAKFVVDAMGLNYPSLKAQEVPEKYHVRGFPTLIIIDQEGNVADIHIGYSPTLRKEVGKEIRKLLAGKKLSE